MTHETQPLGPLTREAFDSLGISFLDASRIEAQREATKRGVTLGDYLKLKREEMLRKANEEREYLSRFFEES